MAEDRPVAYVIEEALTNVLFGQRGSLGGDSASAWLLLFLCCHSASQQHGAGPVYLIFRPRKLRGVQESMRAL